MPKIRILQTTTFGAIRVAKGDVIDIGEDSAKHLVALGKAKSVPDKRGKDGPAAGHDVPVKAKRKE